MKYYPFSAVAEVSRAETTDGRWRNHQSQEVNVPAMPPSSSGTSSSPGSCKEQDRQLERALAAMGGMEGPPVHAIKLELEDGRSASFERGDRGGSSLVPSDV